MNRGVFGGTFDPIHNGHLMVADEVRERLNLEEVIFVPAGQPWLKMDWVISAAEDRLRMMHIALDGKPEYKISDMEIARGGPSYTIDTIREMRRETGGEDELFFILGEDNMCQLPQWREAAELIKLCYLVAVPRPGSARAKLKDLEESLPGITERVMVLKRPEIDISSSNIRERVGQGLSVRHLVPEAVNRYLKQKGLYAAG
ncbi:MAG: nicotinate-nucleotide adenylyltransferase [Dehalococcoidales bacterium]